MARIEEASALGSSGSTTLRFLASSLIRGRSETIERISIMGPNPSNCIVYVGAMIETAFVDGSSTGFQDTSEYPQGLHVPQGVDLILKWDSDTSPCSARVQWV